jgi:hypothetical protein
LEAIALIFTKFSEELITAQLAVLCLTGSLAVYWLLLRKKKKESAEWVSAALVRDYLDRVRRDERDIRMKLFNEDSAATAPAMSHAPLSAALNSVGNDPSVLKELDALRTQLSLSDQRSMEFDRLISSLRSEKASLEQKLKDMPAGGQGQTVAVEDPAMKKEVEDLRARLQEYEVIEDDLANLKKFQKENEVLRGKVEALEKGAASAPAASARATEEPVAHAASAAEVNTNVLQAINPMAEEAPAAPAVQAEKTAKQKEEELLSEFEKMLAS